MNSEEYEIAVEMNSTQPSPSAIDIVQGGRAPDVTDMPDRNAGLGSTESSPPSTYETASSSPIISTGPALGHSLLPLSSPSVSTPPPGEPSPPTDLMQTSAISVDPQVSLKLKTRRDDGSIPPILEIPSAKKEEKEEDDFQEVIASLLQKPIEILASLRDASPTDRATVTHALEFGLGGTLMPSVFPPHNVFHSREEFLAGLVPDEKGGAISRSLSLQELVTVREKEEFGAGLMLDDGYDGAVSRAPLVGVFAPKIGDSFTRLVAALTERPDDATDGIVEAYMEEQWSSNRSLEELSFHSSQEGPFLDSIISSALLGGQQSPIQWVEGSETESDEGGMDDTEWLASCYDRDQQDVLLASPCAIQHRVSVPRRIGTSFAKESVAISPFYSASRTSGTIGCADVGESRPCPTNSPDSSPFLPLKPGSSSHSIDALASDPPVRLPHQAAEVARDSIRTTSSDQDTPLFHVNIIPPSREPSFRSSPPEDDRYLSPYLRPSESPEFEDDYNLEEIYSASQGINGTTASLTGEVVDDCYPGGFVHSRLDSFDPKRYEDLAPQSGPLSFAAQVESQPIHQLIPTVSNGPQTLQSWTLLSSVTPHQSPPSEFRSTYRTIWTPHPLELRLFPEEGDPLEQATPLSVFLPRPFRDEFEKIPTIKVSPTMGPFNDSEIHASGLELSRALNRFVSLMGPQFEPFPSVTSLGEWRSPRGIKWSDLPNVARSPSAEASRVDGVSLAVPDAGLEEQNDQAMSDSCSSQGDRPLSVVGHHTAVAHHIYQTSPHKRLFSPTRTTFAHVHPSWSRQVPTPDRIHRVGSPATTALSEQVGVPGYHLEKWSFRPAVPTRARSDPTPMNTRAPTTIAVPAAIHFPPSSLHYQTHIRRSGFLPSEGGFQSPMGTRLYSTQPAATVHPAPLHHSFPHRSAVYTSNPSSSYASVVSHAAIPNGRHTSQGPPSSVHWYQHHHASGSAQPLARSHSMDSSVYRYSSRKPQ